MRFIGSAVAALLLSACATLPPSPAEEGIAEADIVAAVQCEMRRAKFGPSRLATKLDQYAFALELDLKLVTDTGAGASAVLVLPQAPEMISAGGGFTFAGRSTRQSVTSLQIDPRLLKERPCVVQATGLFSNPDALGIHDWLRANFEGFDKDGAATVASGTYEVEFMLTRGISGSIGVVAYRVTSAGANLSASRTSTHRLKLAATIRREPAGPLEVLIVDSKKRSTPDHAVSADKDRARRREEPGGEPRMRGEFSPLITDRLNDLLLRDRPVTIQTR